MTPSPLISYKAIWRWHFYAGLIVCPFLLILSVTGMIYLFNDEINDAVYPHLRRVAPHDQSVAASHMIAAAVKARPGVPLRIDMPATPDRSAVVYVKPEQGPKHLVYVDPGNGKVLGELVYEQTLVGWADTMHGSLTIGTIGDRIVELAACWALVLIATGLYLWWPRGLKGLGGILYPRLWAKGRMLLRDLHAVTGVWTALLIVFLLLTGLPWAGVQGEVLKQVTGAMGIGYPASTRGYGAPKSLLPQETMKGALGAAPWTLEGAPLPKSDPHAGHPGHGIAPAQGDDAALKSIDMITMHLSHYGLTGGYRLFLPSGPEGVWTAYTYPDQPEGQRTLYFDRYSHQLIREIAYKDYGWAAKAIELGVQLHMGNYFGLANQILMLIPCLGILTLVISGVLMWWKRRPDGHLAAPPRVDERRLKPAFAILIVAGLLMPLLGASLIVVWLGDKAWVKVKRSRPA